MAKRNETKRKLEGMKKNLASSTLNMMASFGITSISFGSRSISKKGDRVIEARKISKSKKEITMYQFIRKVKNVFVPLKDTSLETIDIQPGDVILVLKDGESYGVCGAVYATQMSNSRLICDKSTNMLERLR